MDKVRYGRMLIPRRAVHDALDKMGEVLSAIKFVPLRIELLGHLDNYEYYGYSPYFQEIDKGMMIPEYKLEITEKEGKIAAVKVSTRP